MDGGGASDVPVLVHIVYTWDGIKMAIHPSRLELGDEIDASLLDLVHKHRACRLDAHCLDRAQLDGFLSWNILQLLVLLGACLDPLHAVLMVQQFCQCSSPRWHLPR